MAVSVERAAPWDAFLEREEVKEAVEGFRRSQWPEMQRRLAQEHHYVVPDELEPHWVAPGQGMLYQHTVFSRPDDEGRTDVWNPVLVPLGSPSQLAHYLRKGFRLRENVELFPESALPWEERPAEGSQQEPTQEPPRYLCTRHPSGGGRIGKFGFPTWKAYLQHCNRYLEPLESEPPRESVKAAVALPYYCVLHDMAFPNSRMARQHIRTERQRLVQNTHPTLEQMDTRRKS